MPTTAARCCPKRPAACSSRAATFQSNAKRKHQVLATVETANHCLAVVREYYPKSEMLVMLQATTAVRIGVALGLQWGDFDYSTDRQDIPDDR